MCLLFFDSIYRFLSNYMNFFFYFFIIIEIFPKVE